MMWWCGVEWSSFWRKNRKACVCAVCAVVVVTVTLALACLFDK